MDSPRSPHNQLGGPQKCRSQTGWAQTSAGLASIVDTANSPYPGDVILEWWRGWHQASRPPACRRADERTRVLEH